MDYACPPRRSRGCCNRKAGDAVTFVPQNALEETLMQAASDPAARPEFYRLLLASDLLVIGNIEGQAQDGREQTVSAGQNLQIMPATYKGQNCIPVFSSLVRLQAYLTRQESYVALNGRALFEIAQDAMFVLNPNSDYGKDLLPEEVANLLAPQPPQAVTIDKPTQVLIGQPAVYPHALVDALKVAFAARPQVLAAFLVQIGFPDAAPPPHPLIGVETTGDWKTLSAEIGRIATAAMPGIVLDIAPIDRAKQDDGLTAALLATEPFYIRKIT